jgi:ADP-ribosylglycohydrolase
VKPPVRDGPEFSDRVRGVLFGQAVGDALGFGTELLAKSQVAEQYPTGLRSSAAERLLSADRG